MTINTSPQERISKLYTQYAGNAPVRIEKLPPSGSYRQYFRIWGETESVIGAYNEDKSENVAFISFTKHFESKHLPVAKVLAEDIDNQVYLLTDLGDTMLLNYIQSHNFPYEIRKETIDAYKRTLEELPRFQVQGHDGLDYSLCYPRNAFDRQSMMWDLNYFKYYFLKLAQVPFNEQALENDFETFVNYLLEADCNYFLYRDFQSRNVMMVGNKPYFIDYQGGRKGALQYDLASILFEAKTSLPPDVRTELLEHYIVALNKYVKVDREEFVRYFYGYVFVRIMQAMGAYGFRGLYEKKELFLQSIPLALNHLQWLLNNVKLPVELPELSKVWEYLVESDYIRELARKHFVLKVNINSFSYRRGIPTDESGNGGGFVFDCRSVHNPGRYDQYKSLTGRDPEVQEFLRNEPEMTDFLEHVTALVDRSVDKYLERGFTNLMINFGCTGGQHRSVYSAEMLSKHLTEKYSKAEIILTLRHREQEFRKTV